MLGAPKSGWLGLVQYSLVAPFIFNNLRSARPVLYVCTLQSVSTFMMKRALFSASGNWAATQRNGAAAGRSQGPSESVCDVFTIFHCCAAGTPTAAVAGGMTAKILCWSGGSEGVLADAASVSDSLVAGLACFPNHPAEGIRVRTRTEAWIKLIYGEFLYRSG
jgi:hypothetical protein